MHTETCTLLLSGLLGVHCFWVGYVTSIHPDDKKRNLRLLILLLVFLWGRDTILAPLKTGGSGHGVYGNGMRELWGMWFSSLWLLLSSYPCAGQGVKGWHQASPHTLTQEQRNSSSSSWEHAWEGQMQWWEERLLLSRNFALLKVSVKEIHVLYHTGHVKSLSHMHLLHETSLQLWGFRSLNVLFSLHYLGIV